jgi:hypothetical protein
MLTFKSKGIKRLIVEIVHPHIVSHSAIMSSGNDNFYILMNKENIQKYKLQLGQEINVILEEDTSEFGMPLSEEMQEMLLQDHAFNENFRNLTPGKQRNIIYAVSKIKSSDLRLRTLIVIGEHLKANNGKLDFKMLNQALKNK